MDASMDDKHEARMITASQVLGATPASEYSWRAPSPPHIHVPPVPEKVHLILPPYNAGLIDAGIEDVETREILRRLTGGHYEAQLTDWVYEARRQFQAILSFLYLGPFTASKNVAALKKEGITMLLVVRDMKSAMSGLLSGKKVAEQLGIEHAAIDVDGYSQLIQDGFPKAVNLINSHLVAKYRQHVDHMTNPNGFTDDTPTVGKVLVFCESGNERSAAVVAAYLMAMYDIDLVGAIQYIQTQRFCIAFDDNLKNLLFNYQQILEARKSVVETESIPSSSLQADRGAPCKRTRGDVYNDDSDVEMSMENADDLERFGNRKFAPFYN